MVECVVVIDNSSEGEICLCKGCQFLVAPTLVVLGTWLWSKGLSLSFVYNCCILQIQGVGVFLSYV